MTCYVYLTQCTSVTDRQTDRQTDTQNRHHMCTMIQDHSKHALRQSGVNSASITHL